jgi:hypothetical protein
MATKARTQRARVLGYLVPRDAARATMLTGTIVPPSARHS